MKNNLVCILTVTLCIFLYSGCAVTSKQSNPNQYVKKKYTVTLSTDKKAIFIAGEFDIGIYRTVLKLYKPNRETVKHLIYRSYGGYLNEADKLFKLAQSNQLNTYTLRYCQSACVGAYLGGARRFAAMRTKFGFHQYGTGSTAGLDGGQVTQVKVRQYNDLQKYEKQGISKAFLNKYFGADNTSMWVPTKNQLLDANVVHAYINRNQFPSFDTYDQSLYPDH